MAYDPRRGRDVGDQTAAGYCPARESQPWRHADASDRARRQEALLPQSHGQPDTLPVPKKDSMGMDYIPVHEGEERRRRTGTVKVSADKVQKSGVKTVVVERRSSDRAVRSGAVEVDERACSPWRRPFEGLGEQPTSTRPAMHVSRDQPLLEVYSPSWISAQREVPVCRWRRARPGGIDAGNRRIAKLDGPPEPGARAIAQLGVDAHLARTHAAPTLIFRSPVAVVVREERRSRHARFCPARPSPRSSDLSTVWVIAKVRWRAGHCAGRPARHSRRCLPDQIFRRRGSPDCRRPDALNVRRAPHAGAGGTGPIPAGRCLLEQREVEFAVGGIPAWAAVPDTVPAAAVHRQPWSSR